MTATAVGLLVKKQCETGRYHIGRIVHIVSGDQVHITELADGADWPEEGYGTYDWGIGAKVFRNVDKGTGVGQWQELTEPAVADVSSAASAAAAAALQPSGAPQNLSLTLNAATGVQVHATRPTALVVRGTGAPSLSATGNQTFTVQLLVGSTASSPAPSTVYDSDQGALSVTLVVGVTITTTVGWKLVADIPAGMFVRVIQSAGAAPVTLTSATYQVR